jgi:RNA polymerase sigma-70 factor, ECF subfamily
VTTTFEVRIQPGAANQDPVTRGNGRDVVVGADPLAPRACPVDRGSAGEAGPVHTFALVRRAQLGSGEALGRLYELYVDTVHRYISRRVSDHALAEDLTSETFLRAVRGIAGFTWQGRDFGAWLITIARNLIIDHLKSGYHRREVPTAEMHDSGQSTLSPEDSTLAALSRAALLDAVHRLSPLQRRCVTLRFLDDLSVAETALAIGKSDGAVKALQHRALRVLARTLSGGACDVPVAGGRAWQGRDGRACLAA